MGLSRMKIFVPISRWFGCSMCFLLASSLLAQPADRGGRGGGRGGNLISALDANGDREISSEEILGASAALKGLDRNQDGQLDPDELGLSGRRGPGGGGLGGPGRGGPRGGTELTLVERFDVDGDGVLRGEERLRARNKAREERGRDALPDPADVGRAEAGDLQPDSVPKYPNRSYYDVEVIQTLFLELPQADWEEELSDFYRTDVLVPAALEVDGERYEDVGVSFRGNSSFFTVRSGQKRSINLVMDLAHKGQNLKGYRTLNLLNAHTDPSFLREVTYNLVARNYIPAPQANFVRLVINGEDWGIYVNSQQINREFTEEWFGSRQGVRWKIRAGGGARALNDNGSDPADYKALYEAKSNESEKAWLDLVRVCQALNTIPTEHLMRDLNPLLDIDRALWFLAMDNVLIDSDGYYARGSDYMIYQEPKWGRFHLLPYDSNETFRYPRGGGPGGGARIEVEGVQLSPFQGEENEARPLLNRLLANPEIRARFVAHVRTLHEDWLAGSELTSLFESLHLRIAPHVLEDSRKLYSSESFILNLSEDDRQGRSPTPGLKSFVAARGKYLASLPELKRPAPEILSVARESIEAIATAGQSVAIVARVGDQVPVDSMLLYYATDRNAAFRSVPMESLGDSGQFRGEVPPLPAGSRVYYYAEARSGGPELTVRFWPKNTALGAPSFRINSASDSVTQLVINEVMPVNGSTAQDPQGDFEDWIELHNPTQDEVDLSGMYLTDNEENLRQWRFPSGTVLLPGGYLIVWADNDRKADAGLHASFKLAQNGETLLLVDTDQRGNAIVDRMTYAPLGRDESFGRLPGVTGVGEMLPTPGQANR